MRSALRRGMVDAVICLANRRWSCFYERSQHLMTQCAQERRAVFVEEPEFDTTGPDVELSETRTGVITLIPHMPPTLTMDAIRRAQERAIGFVLAHLGCYRPVLWYYAPAALAYTDHVDAAAMVYDWIDEQPVGHMHQRLLDTADVVFTDGEPDHRQLVHHNVHPFGLELTAPELWRAMWTHVEQAIELKSRSCVSEASLSL